MKSFCAFLLLIAVLPVSAQDHSDVPRPARRHASSQSHDGSSPFPPPSADNVIKIDIDTRSTENNWCTSVDWAELDFGAIAPIFMVHGILSNGADAWANFHTVFALEKIPFSDDINLSEIGSIDGNAAIL